MAPALGTSIGKGDGAWGLGPEGTSIGKGDWGRVLVLGDGPEPVRPYHCPGDGAPGACLPAYRIAKHPIGQPGAVAAADLLGSAPIKNTYRNTLVVLPACLYN